MTIIAKKSTMLCAAITLLCASTAYTQSIPAREFDPSELSQSDMINFADKMAQLSWMGFVRGVYSNSEHTLTVTDECFGEWVVEDLHKLDTIVYGVLSGDYNLLSIDTFYALAYGLQDLFYKNLLSCNFLQFTREVGLFVVTQTSIDQIFTNIQTHAFETITLIEPIFQVIRSYDKITTYEQIYASADLVGYNLGKVFSGIVGFN